jgi:hypothetical protein
MYFAPLQGGEREVSYCLSCYHGTSQSHVEGAGALFHRDGEAGVGGMMNCFGDAGGFAAEQQDVALLELEAGIGRCGFGREQNEALGLFGLLEGCPRRSAGEVHLVEVIHAGAPEARIIPGESCGLDDGEGQAQTGAKPCYCADIWGNIGLIHCNFDHGGTRCSPSLRLFTGCDIL